MTEFFEGQFYSQAGEHPFIDNTSWMTQPFNQPFGRRWYDDIGHMALAIQKTRQLPPSIQKLVAQNLNHNINAQRQSLKNSGSSLSMGTKAVLGLYKSGLKQRWYDKEIPELSRAITMMTTLPEAFLTDYAQRIMGLSEYLNEFSDASDHVSFSKEMNQTIETILNRSYTQLEETQSGIRVSEGAILDWRNPNKHIVATENKNKPH